MGLFGNKRKQREQDLEKRINDLIAESEAEKEVKDQEAAAASALATVGEQYGASGFYRGGNAKDLKEVSESIGSSEQQEVDVLGNPLVDQASNNQGGSKLWSAYDQSTFGNLSGAITDPNAITMKDMLGSNITEQLYA